MNSTFNNVADHGRFKYILTFEKSEVVRSHKISLLESSSITYGMTNPEVIGIDSFVQSLELILSDVIYQVKEQQAKAVLPLHVDKEWIINRVQEQISNDGYVIEPKHTTAPNGLGPFFHTLPTEIRDMIFVNCLASGYPQLMACSRAMREEGLGLIWQKGVYRMNFGIRVNLNLGSGMAQGTPECPPPPRWILNNIQHLCIRVKGTVGLAREFWSSLDLDTLTQFGGSEIRRKCCKIFLQMQFDKCVHIGEEIFVALRTLVGFETVELRIVFPPKTFPRRMTASQKQQVMSKLTRSYIECARRLWPGLGCGLARRDENGRFLAFDRRRNECAL